jgi:hypothetical protein
LANIEEDKYLKNDKKKIKLKQGIKKHMLNMAVTDKVVDYFKSGGKKDGEHELSNEED